MAYNEMVYRRLKIPSHPNGAFIYVLAVEESNSIQIGIGFESRNGLQRTHVATGTLKQRGAMEYLKTGFAEGYRGLRTGKLSAMLGDVDMYTLTEAQCEKILDLITEVRNEAFGHPLDYEPHNIDLGDGRFVWLAYGEEIDKIRIGIGFFDDSGQRRTGHPGYTISQAYLAEFACELFRHGNMLIFMGRPPNWPAELPSYISGEDCQVLAIELVRLGDQVWPGKISAPPGPVRNETATVFDQLYAANLDTGSDEN